MTPEELALERQAAAERRQVLADRAIERLREQDERAHDTRQPIPIWIARPNRSQQGGAA